MSGFVGRRSSSFGASHSDPDHHHYGDADYFFALAFMKGANVPPKIGIDAGTSSGGGGSLGISVASFGLSIGASAGGSGRVYSDEMAAVRCDPGSRWMLVEEYARDEDGNETDEKIWIFRQGECEYAKGHGY